MESRTKSQLERQWTRKQSIQMLRKTSLTAVSSIASTKGTSEKVFKVLVLLFCLVGFLFQSVTFFSYYYEYPTSVDTYIEKPHYTEMPGITFCNTNGINKTKFCSVYPEECHLASKSLCSKYPSYCKANKTLVPKNSSFSKIDEMTLEEFLEVGNKVELSFRKLSGFNDTDLKGPFIRAKTIEGYGRMGCYSWLTVVDTPDDPYMINRTSVIHEPVAKLTFDLSNDDQFIPGQKAGIYFSVHSPFVDDNPYENGHFFKPGRVYKMHISMEKEILLPEPYQTNCTNYTELWLNNNRTGPRIQEMCQHKCILDTDSKFLNCSSIFGLYPHNLRICSHEEIENNMEILLKYGYPCVQNCKDDCAKTKYLEVVKKQFISELTRNEEEYEHAKKLIKVEIYLKDSEVVTFRHRPRYLYVETFSTVGGFIGIWLGISLIQLTDFIETLARILKFIYESRKKSKFEAKIHRNFANN
ncbi:uncharacterized protein LOC129962801 [Argiope bruennichi]|uniref:uncharacterized protein LOC129962801 n=1 Tax=Argiope bruennichi TaxID=94029 RepID=UPI002493F4BE|nr:uncharacterized protein LOC129962801 [Argiope bruennichi]